MDFTKEQLSEVLCKHAERENGLQDLIGRNGPREDLRQLHRAHHPLGTPQDGGRHPRKTILVGIRHAGQSGDLLQGPLHREIQGHLHHS